MKSIIATLGIDNNSILMPALKGAGYSILQTQSINEILKLWPKPGFSTLIIDEGVSDWDYKSVELREQKFNGPIILLAGEENLVKLENEANHLSLEPGVIVMGKDMNKDLLPKIIRVLV